MPKKFKHTMEDVCELLDKRIDSLRALKVELQGRIKENVGVQTNAEALRQVSASLAHARDARYALGESCCGMSCEIDYE